MIKCDSNFQFYLAGKRVDDYYHIRASLTYDLILEKIFLKREGFEWFWPISVPGPLYPTYYLKESYKRLSFAKRWPLDRKKSYMKKVSRWLKKNRYLKEYCDSPLSLVETGSRPLSNQGLLDKLRFLIKGKNIFINEIQDGLAEMGLEVSLDEIKKCMVPLLVKDEIELLPANLPEPNVCLRCESRKLDQTYCGLCRQETWTCPDCLSMGESLTCRPLFRDNKIKIKKSLQKVSPLYNFSLSPYQKELSQGLKSALDQKDKYWLLWAVCGAGKTEVTFAMIGEALSRGGRVLFTSPRREVVRQMEKRLDQAFPGVEQVGLYGGSQYKYLQGQLFVSTVHQLVRFYQTFDLIIFDEVDAYPYQGNKRLERLLERSLAPNGQVVYLSATPSDKLLYRVKKGDVNLLTLPARYHQHPVPLPQLLKSKLPTQPDWNKMPYQIREMIDFSLAQEYQLFIFLPTRKMVERFGRSFQLSYINNSQTPLIEYTHSKDEERSTKVNNFLDGEYPILVTTTIMERGVTVPKSNVLVLYADQEHIFNHQSLIQMAGRAGRSYQAPDGKVWFLARRKSKEMGKARRLIFKINKEAKRRNLITEEGIR